MSSATSFYEFKPLDKRGKAYPLTNLKGKVVLVVNTASKCGFTPQLTALEALYKDLKKTYPDDVEILGFPCNQFGAQDPGSNDEIQEFCMVNYGVSFPVLGKTDVNGDKAEPVWEWMKGAWPGLMGFKRVKWNFEKFLVGRDGKVKGRWASTTSPESLKAAILAEVKKSKPAASTATAAAPAAKPAATATAAATTVPTPAASKRDSKGSTASAKGSTASTKGSSTASAKGSTASTKV